MMNRSLRAEVRNPLLLLPSASAMSNLDPAAKAALRALLKDLQADSRKRAEEAWKAGKAPMAVYWRAVSVYANHSSRLLKPTERTS